MSFSTLLLILAFLLFLLDAFGVVSRVNKTALGLACWVLALLIAGGTLWS